MLIDYVKNAIRVGEFILHPTHSKKLSIQTDPNLSKDDYRNEVGRVYFITIDGKIVKIGGSQCKGGIQGTIGAYLGGFAKGMSPRTYCVWNYLRQAISKGQKAEIYMILAPMTTAKIPSMREWRDVEIATDFHAIESFCVSEYLEQENDYPFLNMQESGRRWIDTGLLEGYPGIIETKNE